MPLGVILISSDLIEILKVNRLKIYPFKSHTTEKAQCIKKSDNLEDNKYRQKKCVDRTDIDEVQYV